MTGREQILHHIAIQAEDYNESLRFYTTVLDFKVKHTWALPQYNIKQAALLQPADGGSGIELFDKDANVGARYCIEPTTIDLHPLKITNALVYGPNSEVIEFIERNEHF